MTKEEATNYAVDHYKQELDWRLSRLEDLEDNRAIAADEEDRINTLKELLKSPEVCYDSYFKNNQKDKNGNILSTYNPESKWDWWQLGGRFSESSAIKGEDEEDCVNEAMAKEIDWERTPIPFCFVDDDGEWHAVADIGWFAITSNEKADEIWNTEFKNYVQDILKRDPDIMVTAIDFHI